MRLFLFDYTLSPCRLTSWLAHPAAEIEGFCSISHGHRPYGNIRSGWVGMHYIAVYKIVEPIVEIKLFHLTRQGN